MLGLGGELQTMSAEKPMTEFQVEALVTLSKFNSLSANKLSIARGESRKIKQQLKDVLVKESFIYDSLAKFSEDMTVEREIIRMSINNFQNHINAIQPKGEQAKKTLQKLQDEAQDINEFLVIFSTKMKKEKIDLDAVFASYKLELQAILDSASDGVSPTLKLAHSPLRTLLADSLDVVDEHAASFDCGNAEAKLPDGDLHAVDVSGNDYDEYGIPIPLVVLNSPKKSVTLTSFSSPTRRNASPEMAVYSVGEITKSNDINLKYMSLYAFAKKLSEDYKELKGQFRAELAAVFRDLSDLKYDVSSVVSTIVKNNNKLLRAKTLECKELIATNTSVEHSLSDIRKRHDDLISMYQEMEVKYNSAIEDNGYYTEKISELNDTVVDMNRTITSVSTQKDDLIVKVGAKSDEIEKYKLDIMHLNTDMSTLNKMLSTIQQQKDHMEKNLHSKSDEFEKANIIIHELENKNRDLARENNTKGVQKEDLEKRLHDKSDELDVAKVEISDLSVKVSDLNRSLGSLLVAKEDVERKEIVKTNELEKAEKMVVDFKSIIDDLNRTISNANVNKKDLEEKLSVKSTEIEKTLLNVTQLTSEVANLYQQISTLMNEKSHLENNLKDKERALDTANKTVFEMKSSLGDITRGNQTSTSKIEDLEKKLQLKSEECERAKIEVSDLSSKVVDLGRSIATITSTKDDLDRKYSSLNEQFKLKLAEMEMKNSEILQIKESDNERLKSISDLQARVQQLVENQAKSSDKSPKEYESEISELKKAAAVLKEEQSQFVLSNKDLLIRVHNLDAEWHKALNKIHLLESAQKELHTHHEKISKDHHERLQKAQSEHGFVKGEMTKKHSDLEAISTALIQEKAKMAEELENLNKKLGDMQHHVESSSLKMQEESKLLQQEESKLQETNKKLLFEVETLRASSSDALTKKIDELQVKDTEVQNLLKLNASLQEKTREYEKQRDVAIQNGKEDYRSLTAQLKVSEEREAARELQIADLKKTIKSGSTRLATKEEELDVLLQELKRNEALVLQLDAKIRDLERATSHTKSKNKISKPEDLFRDYEDPEASNTTPVSKSRGPASLAQALAVSPLTEELMALSDNIAPPSAVSSKRSPKTPKGKAVGVEDASPSRLVSPGSGEFKYANKIRQSSDFSPTDDR